MERLHKKKSEILLINSLVSRKMDKNCGAEGPLNFWPLGSIPLEFALKISR